MNILGRWSPSWKCWCHNLWNIHWSTHGSNLLLSFYHFPNSLSTIHFQITHVYSTSESVSWPHHYYFSKCGESIITSLILALSFPRSQSSWSLTVLGYLILNVYLKHLLTKTCVSLVILLGLLQLINII